MKNSWESKKILAYGKRFSVFTSIMLVLLFAFSCSNLIMNDGGSLIIAVPGARAASASSYFIELTGSNGTTQSKTVAGGTTAQFDDLAPDTYNISVKGKDGSGLVVLYGMSNATVEAGATASATVNLGAVANDLNSLLEVIRNQRADGTIYVADGIEVGSDLGASYSANIIFQAGYENTTIKNTYGVLFQLFSSYEILVGGGDYTFTIDGTTAAGGKNAWSGMKISGVNNATMGLVSNGIIQNYEKAISISGKSETQKSYFKLDGGLIKDNKVGIEVGANSVFTMTSGSIEGNTDKGVYVNGGTFNMMGGTISGAGTSSGVYVESGTFTMSNNAVVDSSTSVYLAKDTFITISGKLNGAETVATITPVTYSAGTQVLQAENGVDLAAMVEKFAVTPNPDGTQWFIDTSGKLQEGVCVSDFASLENAISAGGTVYITKAITMERTLDINKEVTLLSTTQSVVLTGPNSGNLFTVSTGGDLTIGDANHAITLDGNKKSSPIIQVNGGTVSLANGTITNANASGVYVNGGTFNMTGGSITGNATSNGGGVYVNTGATFTMSGSAVVTEDNDVYLSEGTTIFVSDDLSGGIVAKITPHKYEVGLSLLSNAPMSSSIHEKFTVTPGSFGQKYQVVSGGTLGELVT